MSEFSGFFPREMSGAARAPGGGLAFGAARSVLGETAVCGGVKISLPPNERRFNGLLWRSLLMPVFLLLAASALLTWATGRMLENAEGVRVSDDVIGRANWILKLGVDMEMGVRGYQLTGDRTLLHPYDDAGDAIRTEFAARAQLATASGQEAQTTRAWK